MRHLTFAFAAGLLLSACHAAPTAAPAATRDVVLTIAPARTVLTTVHRWVSTDVYQYEVQLQVLTNGSWVNSGAAIVLPQTGTPKSTVAFSNLAQGQHYQAVVVAKGNVNHSDASKTLNSKTACVVDLDFSVGTNDVNQTITANAQVAFDPVDFSGTLRFSPQDVPLNTTQYDIYFITAGGTPALLYANQALSAGQVVVVQNLKLDTAYQLRFDAKNAGGTVLHSATSAATTFDSSSQDLEQDVTVTVPFSKPAVLTGTIQ
jgi:hypothetical protein